MTRGELVREVVAIVQFARHGRAGRLHHGTGYLLKTDAFYVNVARTTDVGFKIFELVSIVELQCEKPEQTPNIGKTASRQV